MTLVKKKGPVGKRRLVSCGTRREVRDRHGNAKPKRRLNGGKRRRKKSQVRTFTKTGLPVEGKIKSPRGKVEDLFRVRSKRLVSRGGMKNFWSSVRGRKKISNRNQE